MKLELVKWMSILLPYLKYVTDHFVVILTVNKNNPTTQLN